MRVTTRHLVFALLAVSLAAFLAWRFLRPMNIFVVSEAFERPIPTVIPTGLKSLAAAECGSCHREIYEEWRTAIHSQAWTDPYFQVDWKFDGSQQVCMNCHIPLDRQQEHAVVGFRDRDKSDPILGPNSDFDRGLQSEGVTCAACHLREGRILGPRGGGRAPHPVGRLGDSNQVCVRCHVVGGDRWDTFYRFPPCGTVMEIEQTRSGRAPSRSGEARVKDTAALGCVQCHMPLAERRATQDEPSRPGRRHWWRGGHDPAMVRSALAARLDVEGGGDTRRLQLTITNVGADHFLPTGTPDRHLTATLRALDGTGKVLSEESAIYKRTVLWRPFIVDLWDTRLPRGAPRRLALDIPRGAAAVEAEVRYHLLAESRRRRIGYQNREPIDYPVFHELKTLTREQ